MMSDGYMDWLAIAPEGKIPARSGTSSNPKEYIDGWIKLSAGVDKKEPLTDIYPAEVLTTIACKFGKLRSVGHPARAGRVGSRRRRTVRGSPGFSQDAQLRRERSRRRERSTEERGTDPEGSRRLVAAVDSWTRDPRPGSTQFHLQLPARRAGTYEHQGAPCPQR